jgi:flagella basal body P-ring formation protein FlgA
MMRVKGLVITVTVFLFLAMNAAIRAAAVGSGANAGCHQGYEAGRQADVACAPPDSGSALVPLKSHVTLHSGAITLADLLPESAAPELRQEAESISLGTAPEPPMSRILYRQQLQFLLQDHKSLLAELRLPDEVVVERFYRALTQEEVIQAIQHATGHQGINAEGGLDFANIHLSSPIYVTSNDPGLEVIRVESDPLRGATRFRLWTSKEPGNLPFEVSVPGAVKLPTLVSRHALASGEIVSASDFEVVMKPGAGILSGKPASIAQLTGLETRAPLQAGQPVARTEFAPPVLVRAGTLATLSVQGPHFSIKTVVVPLEQGVLGQEIRVRNPETREVVEAKVIGRDRLLKGQ